MTTILLDKTLKPHPLREHNDWIINQFTDKKTDWQTKVTTQTIFPVAHNLKGDCQHLNYLEYLEGAWSGHYGIVLAPDHIWYTLLCEATAIVAADPEKYRDSFTRSKDKVDICVETESDTVIPLDKIIDALKRHVPGQVVEDLTPDFSTTNTRARLARFAAFADMVSPYYNYRMLACGIPSIRLDGSRDDWSDLQGRFLRLGELLPGNGGYFHRVAQILGRLCDQFTSPDSEWLKGIFYAKRCGSGSDATVHGWFTDLFLGKPNFPKAEHFPTHAATVKYRNLTTGKDFTMKQGLFGSSAEDGILVPDFGMVVYERITP